MTAASDTITRLVAAALARRPLPPRSPAWMFRSLVERTALILARINSADEVETKNAAQYAAELVVFSVTARPQGSRRRKRRDVASLMADRALFEHGQGEQLNYRERELVRNLAALGAIRHLRAHPSELEQAQAVARDLVDVCIGVALPAHADQPAR